MSPTVLRLACISLAALLLAAGCSASPPAPEQAVQPPQAWSGDPSADSTDDVEEAEEDRVEVCVRKATSIRVDYQLCDDKEKGYARRLLPATARIPAIGRKVGKGTTGEYDGLTYRAPKKGGKGVTNMILDRDDRIEICVRKETRVRAADKHCENDRSGYGWYYLPLSRRIPAVGRKAAKGSYFSNEYSESFKARPSGGKGSKAMVVEEEPPAVTDDAGTRTRTYSGTCSMTIGGSCANDDGGSTPSWTGRCTTCTRRSTGRRR
ncbi:hypothetical protein AB0J71_46655 [Nonomuraea sp. NPDC049637]|uniref:hypothetical protein n=1 Tax=Nonomuraea sp. NPDC049637 TaxID=3154356 RepID=UPI003442169C